MCGNVLCKGRRKSSQAKVRGAQVLVATSLYADTRRCCAQGRARRAQVRASLRAMHNGGEQWRKIRASAQASARKCAQVCTNVRKCAEMCASARKCAQMRASARKCAQVCASVRKCAQVCANVHKCAQMCVTSTQPLQN